MTGVYQHSIDAKGRLAIPARLREELGDSFYVMRSSEKCLTVRSSDSWNEFMEKINALPMSRQIKMRPIFSGTAKCEPDAQGRILIPQNLRDFANLSKNVTVVGASVNFVQIWDADEWAKVDEIESTPEYIKEIFDEPDV